MNILEFLVLFAVPATLTVLGLYMLHIWSDSWIWKLVWGKPEEPHEQ